MTFEDKFWLLILGALISVITALVTNWLNRRWLADEVAQNKIVETYIEIYRKLGKNIAAIQNDALQLLAYLAAESNRMKAEGKNNNKILLEINKEFNTKSIDLLKRVSSLKEEYVFLPAQVVLLIKNVEETTWHVFKNATSETLRDSYKIIDSINLLLSQIRSIMADIMSRRKKVSSIIEDIPPEGFASNLEKKAVQELKDMKTKTANQTNSADAKSHAVD